MDDSNEKQSPDAASMKEHAPAEATPRKGPSRRGILLGAAGMAAAAGLGAGSAARANYTGLMPGGGTIPLRLPLGAMNHLDRNEYIHNMEIISHVPGARTAGGEPLMAMWARGTDRLLPAGDEGWVDVSDPRNPSLVETGTSIGGCVAYNTRLKKWLMVDSASQPSTRPSVEYPRGRYHEEYFRRAVSYRGLRGITVHDITDPENPKLLNEFSTGETGGGTHMNFYDGGRYAYLDAGFSDQLRMENRGRPHGNAMMVVDLSDPENVREVSRWHVPGHMIGEEDAYKEFLWAGDKVSWTSTHGGPVVPQRIEDGGRLGYLGYGHFGMFVMDLSDIENPRPIGRARWQFETTGGIPYHSIYPVIANDDYPQLRNLVIGVPEALQPDCREPYKPAQVIDVSDPENPRIIGLFPRPQAPADAPYSDFCFARGRFGTHNIQCWLAPGNSRPNIVVMTHFVGGIRVYDISDPTAPQEVAFYVPARTGEIEDYDSWFRGEGERVFIEWDRNLIWLGARGGSYCLSTPALGEPVLERRRVANWSVPHGNRGWDD